MFKCKINWHLLIKRVIICVWQRVIKIILSSLLLKDRFLFSFFPSFFFPSYSFSSSFFSFLPFSFYLRLILYLYSFSISAPLLYLSFLPHFLSPSLSFSNCFSFFPFLFYSFSFSLLFSLFFLFCFLSLFLFILFSFSFLSFSASFYVLFCLSLLSFFLSFSLWQDLTEIHVIIDEIVKYSVRVLPGLLVNNITHLEHLSVFMGPAAACLYGWSANLVKFYIILAHKIFHCNITFSRTLC